MVVTSIDHDRVFAGTAGGDLHQGHIPAFVALADARNGHQIREAGGQFVDELIDNAHAAVRSPVVSITSRARLLRDDGSIAVHVDDSGHSFIIIFIFIFKLKVKSKSTVEHHRV